MSRHNTVTKHTFNLKLIFVTLYLFQQTQSYQCEQGCYQKVKTLTVEKCQQVCNLTDGCYYWTWELMGFMCHLKGADGWNPVGSSDADFSGNNTGTWEKRGINMYGGDIRQCKGLKMEGLKMKERMVENKNNLIRPVPPKPKDCNCDQAV